MFFFFSSRRRHTRLQGDWSSDVCSSDLDPHWCAADPELGARHAVAEAARHVAVTGARPWALTDCLNFGDAEDPAVMGDFEATIDGLATAATALGGLAAAGAALPFVSGNVSLYNHSGGRSI